MTVLTPSRGRVTRQLAAAAWDPNVQQFAEADTVLLADLTDLASINAQGGVLQSPSNTPQDAADYSFETDDLGQSAIRPLGTNSGTHVFYPLDGLIAGDEFTVEMRAMHPTLDWTAVSSRTLFSLECAAFSLPWLMHSATSGLSATWNLYPGDTTGRATGISVTQSLAGLGLTAGTWHSVAMVLAADVVKLYVDGVLRKTVAGVVLPDTASDRTDRVGLTIGGRVGSASGFAVSGVRVSRTARVPGATTVLRSLTGHLDVDTTSNAGAIPAGVIGALGMPPWVGADFDQINGAVRMMRIASLVNASPIKAGGTDATHPTLGQSGSYSYDWQVVDRTLTEAVRLGSRLFINLDRAPQILGGAAPLSGVDLTTHGPGFSAGSPTIPNNKAAWATICQDFAHHILVTEGFDVAMWGFWNEPSVAHWTTHAAYTEFLIATAQAVRAVDPTAYIVAGDLGVLEAVWLEAIFEDVAAVDPGLIDAMSIHEYSGELTNWEEIRAVVDFYADASGFDTPFPIVLGEFNWSNRLMHSANPDPGYFETMFLHVMAFGAAFTTAYICRALADPGVLQGLCFSHISAYSGDPRDGSYAVDQLISRLAEADADDIADQFAPYNALAGLQQTVGNRRLTINTSALPPGVHAYAGKDTVTGRIGVVIASHGWANRTTRTVHLHLTGMTGSKRLRRYLVDPEHSSRWDIDEDGPGGDPYQDLELVEDRTDTGARLRDIELEVPKWSAQFLTLDPV